MVGVQRLTDPHLQGPHGLWSDVVNRAHSTPRTRAAYNTQAVTHRASWTNPHTDGRRVPVQAHGHAQSRGLTLAGVLWALGLV